MDERVQFMERVFPALQRASFYPGPEREDLAQETYLEGWRMYLSAVARGRDPTRFPGRLAMFARQHVRQALARRLRRERTLSSPWET